MDLHRLHVGRGAAVAWGGWALLLAAGIWFVATYAFTIPYVDEWAWLPVVAGREPISLSWLWSLHNEHRMVLPRLIYLGLGFATAFDFRAGSYYNILALGALSLAMMLTARSIRGRTSAYDIFFPLLLLHWAQYENIVWGFQVNFTTSVLLAGVVLITVARCGPQLRLRAAVLITVCLIAMGLSGLYGLAYLPAMACWLGFAGVWRWRSGEAHARRDGLLMFAFAAMLLALVGAYFIDFHMKTCHSPGIWATTLTTLQFLAGGVGSAAKGTWPVSGVIVAVACVLLLRQLYRVIRHRPAERLRVVGLFCFFGGVGSLALAIGMGRADAGPKAGFMERYMTLGTPLFCLFFLQVTLYTSATLKIHLQRTLALLLLGFLVINTCKGLAFANNNDRLMAQLKADIRAGVPPADLATRHGDEIGLIPRDVFASRLELLRQARLGPYRDYAGNDGQLLGVQRLANVSTPRVEVERARLLPGQSVTQCFDVPSGAMLSRIDVQISRCRGCRTLEHVAWSLYSAGPSGSRRLIAHDTIDMGRVGRDDFVTLTIPPASNAAVGTDSQPAHFALVLSPPSECPSGQAVELPLYSCDERAENAFATDALPLPANAALSLKGFLFLKRADLPVASMASKPSTVR